MAMSGPCSGCGNTISLICAAQYAHKEQFIILCSDCYANGVRCWFVDNRLLVSNEQPDGSKMAVLYWDEGGFVTGGLEPFMYPKADQPDSL